MKRQIWEAQFQTLAEAMDVAADEMRRSFVTADFKEGVAHFLEKRPPSLHRQIAGENGLTRSERSGDRFVVEGGRTVGGTLAPAGNKNEALPVLAASLLAPGASRFGNLPRIRDVATQIEILGRARRAATRDPDATETVLDTENLAPRAASSELGRTIRGSFLLAPGLLHRTGRAVLPRPGGDRIGRRRVDTHLHALRMLGAEVEARERQYHLTLSGRFRGGDIFLDEASVMATENAVMAAAVADGATRIANAACEPHVQGLCRYLNAMGARDPRRRHERARDRGRAASSAGAATASGPTTSRSARSSRSRR